MPQSPDDIGTVTVEGDRATISFQRRFSHPPETIWKALTNPAEFSGWYIADGTIEPRKGGYVDLYEGPYRLHVTGRILEWDPPSVFEHEWKVAPRSDLPSGEDAIIRWELRSDGEGTILRLEHRNLGRRTALGFAPGAHAFLDRLDAHLDRRPLPDWYERIKQLTPRYPPSWVSR